MSDTKSAFDSDVAFKAETILNFKQHLIVYYNNRIISKTGIFKQYSLSIDHNKL